MTDLIADSGAAQNLDTRLAGDPPRPLECGICGHTPAVDATFRAHRGYVVFVKVPKSSMPFCRDCGLVTFRDMTAETLIAGWWSPISFFVSPVVILLNLMNRRKVAKLAAPTRTSQFVAPNMRPLPPARPVLARPRSWIGLVLITALLVFVAMLKLGAGEPKPEPGCVREDYLISCDKAHDARVIAVVPSWTDCPAEAAGYIEIRYRYYCVVIERTR